MQVNETQHLSEVLRKKQKNLTPNLLRSFGSWLVLDVVFFCTIDPGYLGTFFGTKMGPQHACELFKTIEDKESRFFEVFYNGMSYTKAVHREVKEWVRSNIN